MNLFYLFPEPSSRAAILTRSHRYESQRSLWFGLDAAERFGHTAMGDFEVRPTRTWTERFMDRACNSIWSALGGSGGNWFRPLIMRKHIKNSDVIICTADRAGIPLVLLMAWGLIPKRPVVYMSIGLPERWETLSGPMQRLYRRAFHAVATRIVCFGYEEHERIQHDLSMEPQRVVFVPFGVDTSQFIPAQSHPDGSILSIGADPNRDFDLLIEVAKDLQKDVHIITTAARATTLRTKWGSLPPNLTIQTDVPFSTIPSLIEQAFCVVLPLHSNSYSGATTTLLQSMSMGKAVIVSKTGAIKGGYHLVHGQNVLLVDPGDEHDLRDQLQWLLAHPEAATQLGVQASHTVRTHLSWNHFVTNLFDILRSL